MTLEEAGKRAATAADILHALVHPGDEVGGPREDLHADDVEALQQVVRVLGDVEDELSPGMGVPNPDGLRLLREARDVLGRVPSWRLPDNDAQRDYADALRLIDNSLAALAA
jgi:hypothetical protein